MVGGGGKIGGPPGVPPPVTPETTSKAPQPDGKPTAMQQGRATDSFEKAAARTFDAGGARPNALGPESSGSTDLLRLARDNPAAARRLVATLASKSATTLSQIEAEIAAARVVLEKLARERFAEEARNQKRAELDAHRRKIAALKRQLATGARKMALLQQLAGQLGDPRLDHEITRLLGHNDKLKTDWGRRHHLLSIGSSLYGDDAGTPEHLRRVIKAEVRGTRQADDASETMQELSPRRVIAELVARTLDGSVREPREPYDDAARGQYGKSMQGYALLADVLDAALARDPLDEGES
jgi:hypothetical protein